MRNEHTARMIEQHAMACAGAAKALSELRDTRKRTGDTPALRAHERRLQREIEAHQRRIQALLSDAAPRV
jgi:hypothetical protein